jgi:hypothetical protein
MFLSMVFLSACSLLTDKMQGEPATPPDLNGVWAVSLKYNDGSCPDVSGGSQSAMWTVNQGSDGMYLVSVQGTEATTLWGKADGGAVRLTGLTGGYDGLMTDWRLTGAGASVSGRMIETMSGKVMRPAAAEEKGTRISLWGGGSSGDSEKSVKCAVVWTVEAKKQGT